MAAWWVQLLVRFKERAISLVKRARFCVDEPEQPMMFWSHRILSERGTAERPNKSGYQWLCTAVELQWQLADFSTRVIKKGEGPVIARGLSRHGGSTDAECTGITGLFLDCDVPDGGVSYREARALLDDLYFRGVGQCRPASGKAHYELRIFPTLDVGPDPVVYKKRYRQELAYVIGVMSELAFPGDDTRQFDPTTDRLLNLNYVYTRREESDPIPETFLLGDAEEEYGIDWPELLAATAFPEAEGEAETNEAVRRVEVSRATGRGFTDAELGDRPSLLRLAFAEAGMLGHELGGGKVAVRCPWESQHSTGTRFNGSTLLWPPVNGGNIGGFWCSHHCGSRDWGDVLDVLPPEAVERAWARHDALRSPIDEIFDRAIHRMRERSQTAAADSAEASTAAGESSPPSLPQPQTRLEKARAMLDPPRPKVSLQVGRNVILDALRRA